MNPIINVSAGIIIRGKKVLIAKRNIHKHLGGLWEFPGGKVQRGESAEDTLIRELQEELDVRVTIQSFFSEHVHEYPEKTIRLLSYLITDIDGDIVNKEHEELKWVQLENLLDYQLAEADITIAQKLINQNRQSTRSYYSNTISGFLSDHKERILGRLVSLHNNTQLIDQQRNAWQQQIDILKQALIGLEGFLFFEFAIPRMGKRVDNILIINELIFVLEFKVGDSLFKQHAKNQVIDYALDLKNFHQGSHHARLMPVLISTKAENNFTQSYKLAEKLEHPICTNSTSLRKHLQEVLNQSNGIILNGWDWEQAIYKPTPTIVEAAQALYKGHKVQEISRSDAGAINLTKTANCLNSIIVNSKCSGSKSICFVTGVPGAGKTLAGLNIANERMKIDEEEHAVFLSGNGPLVQVLREALARDVVETSKYSGNRISKKDTSRKTNAFIQNIHHFRDEYLKQPLAPTERVVVFDEAQRAWNKDQAASFMKRKKGIDNFDQSEPEFLIDVMDRHESWCNIICLIGGGQEINTGEAGLEEWINALRLKFPDWNVYYSEKIIENKNYLQDAVLKQWLKETAKPKTDLHLAVSIRSFRSEKLSAFIEALLDLEIAQSKKLYQEIKDQYPIYLTRDLGSAKEWIRGKSKGTERYGLLASSGARRLRAIGIDVKNKVDAPNWFLNEQEDIRSSYFLEEVATEFDIQGLEIDWSIVTWGADLYKDQGKWVYQKFSGTAWRQMKKVNDKKYLLNTYRVLLTRARQGMVLYIPEGSTIDNTRPIRFYDQTYLYLLSLGIKKLES
ncbi:DNA/RNA helicase domain-containing protein [Zeaxanthinibacter enoshimensis]|uniref:Mutator protein MutT n=1 Tax=Zeaxanthinibacter enoshimensis TaxID=392009 RepID=A0A4R6TP69_9FLAO|nr:DNA/RNA helicase domain-containing protein [Zeaxanthinibacter enoshimensis]TDQ33384.1 mutator protein MutT [Zeaxanthinibacter enoshimensis]